MRNVRVVVIGLLAVVTVVYTESTFHRAKQIDGTSAQNIGLIKAANKV